MKEGEGLRLSFERLREGGGGYQNQTTASKWGGGPYFGHFVIT